MGRPSVDPELMIRMLIIGYFSGFIRSGAVRRWVNHLGPKIAADLRKRRPKPHAVGHLDDVYLKIDGRLV